MQFNYQQLTPNICLSEEEIYYLLDHEPLHTPEEQSKLAGFIREALSTRRAAERMYWDAPITFNLQPDGSYVITRDPPIA